MTIFLADATATERLGALLWVTLPVQCLVFLQGDLGVGKTTLVRGFLRAAGFCGAVKSPTYNLVEEYTLASRQIFHFDLYRLADPEELEWMGIRDYFVQENVCFIEWPTQGGNRLPTPDLILRFQASQIGRTVEIDVINLALKNSITNMVKQIDTDII